MEQVAVVFASNPPQEKQTTPLENLLALPHRLFFFAGVVQCFLFISLLGSQYAGLFSLKIGFDLYHSYAFCFIIFTQFFVGFLLTTFPRYLSRPNVTKEKYIPSTLFINTGALLFIALSFFSHKALVFPMALIFYGYIRLSLILWTFQKESVVTNKQDTTWILVSFLLGGIGHALFILNLFIPTYSYAFGFSFYLYLFFLVFIVSQKMMPFFTSNAVIGYTINKSKHLLVFIFIGLLLKVTCENLGINAILGNALLFILITYELIKWKLPFNKAPAILWVLFLSIWWAPMGFGLFVLQDLSMLFGWDIYLEKAPLHALALGYFTTILVGFGTRIILGHSGRKPNADKYAITLFMSIQVMTLFRVLAGIFPQIGYTNLILMSVFIWLLVFTMWSKRYLPILFEK